MPRMGVALTAGLICFTSGALAGGPYLAQHPEELLGTAVDTGYCVEYVKKVTGVPLTTQWRPGRKVQGATGIPSGTAIATFEADGTYTSKTGNHAAIYLSQDENGLWVYDQWRGHKVAKRLIRFGGGKNSRSGSKSNNGELFKVIE